MIGRETVESCYIRNNICFNRKTCISDIIENIFINLLFPKTKPTSIGIIYQPPSQSQFLQQMITEFEALVLGNEIYVLDDFNINLLFRDKYVFNKSNEIKKLVKNLLPEIKRYKEFCSMYGLSQLIDCPARVTSNNSTLIDHILTNTQENISQSGVIDAAVSDHSLIFCTRKIPKAKYNRHKEKTFCSLKSYLPDVYKETLERVSFPNYENFDNPDVGYSYFITRLECVINAIAPFKTVRIKNNASEWFDGEIAEKIHTRDKLYKKFKSTKLHVDEEIYKEARNTVQNLIRKKKKAYFEEKLKGNTANSKKLWKTLKQLGLPEKKLPCTDVCLKVKEDLKFDPFTICELFKKFYYNLANDLVHELPAVSKKIDIEAVKDYYNDMFELSHKKLNFQTVQPNTISNLLKSCNEKKAAGIDIERWCRCVRHPHYTDL